MYLRPFFPIGIFIVIIVPSFGFDIDFEIETPDGFIRKKYQVKNDFGPTGSVYEHSESYHEAKGYKTPGKLEKIEDFFGFAKDNDDDDAPKHFERIYNEAKQQTKPKKAKKPKKYQKASKKSSKKAKKAKKLKKPKKQKQNKKEEEVDYYSIPYSTYDFDESYSHHSPLKYLGFNDDNDGLVEHSGHNYEKSYSKSYKY